MTAGVRRCRSRPCCVFGLQGPSRPQELCAGTLPGHDAGRCGTGRRRRACGAGKPGGRAVSVTAPIPAVRDQAFSCPWLPGSRGARTCSGRRRPQTCLAARIRWSARLTLGRRRAVCKTVGSAYVGSNPTPATTCGNGPLAAETRPRGCFRSCHVAYQSVSLCVEVSRCPRTYSGRRPGRLRGRGHRRLSTDGHGRPRQKGPCPCPGAVPVPCAARRPASPGTGGRGGGRKDERCGRPWLLLPGARAGSSCTGEGARPGRLSLNVIHPGRPGGPDPSRTPNRREAAAVASDPARARRMGGSGHTERLTNSPATAFRIGVPLGSGPPGRPG